MSHTYETKQSSDWGAVARAILTTLPERAGATVLALSGTLGAGKTTFTQALARELGVAESVVSPTFVLMQRYGAIHPRFHTLVHIDAYRFNEPQEAEVLRLDAELTDPKTLVVIEWPEQMESYMPNDAIRVAIDITPEDGRIITISD